MKKIVILLILISMLICPLCSCQQKNITVGDVTGDLYFEETDCGMNIMFNDVKYNVFTGDLKGFYFYRATDQLVTYLWGRLGLYGLYVVNNPDFGIAFTPEDVLLRLMGNPYDFPRYILSEDAEVPSLETVAIDDIVHVENMGRIQDVVYTEWSNVNEMASSGWTKVYDRSLWNGENDTVTLGELVDFTEPFTLTGRYMKFGEIVFTPAGYESFFCGPFDVIWTNGGEFYLRFSFNTDDEHIYKVQDKYQSSFEKMFEPSSFEWEYILSEDTSKAE